MTIPTPGALGLPLGRWIAVPADLDELTKIGDEDHRRALVSEWRTLTDAVRSAVGRVPACWLGGSFFTTKERPSDLDCVYVLHHDDLQAAQSDPEKAQFLAAIVGKGARENFGLRVDTYYLDWWPRPGTLRGSEERRSGYLQDRGYWDDLWSRSREGELAEQKLPRRGYLEVIVDGYV